MRHIKNAIIKAEKAQRDFISAIKSRGRKILKMIDNKTIVIVGRAYNAFDHGLNLEIPRKLADLGVFSIPMDYLPIETVDINRTWSNMYWRSGQNILRAAEIIRNNPNLYAIYIGNFLGGPDSFIHKYFKETMAGKPFLQLEIDEHSADAGIVTRCEAFLDSIGHTEAVTAASSAQRTTSLAQSTRHLQKRVIYIPRMSDHAFALAAAFESSGINAEVMTTPDTETVKIGRRFLSGKECYPCIVTTGEMVKKVLSDGFDPTRSAFFMPSGSGPCRFGQYNILHRLVLDKAGFSDVPILSPNQDSSLYTELGIIGNDFTKQAWKGIIATELLMKCLHETRPYEVNKGESENLYAAYLQNISENLKSQNGAFDALFQEIRDRFSKIPRTDETRPLIGVIGEIFVRHNAFSNENIVKKVEALGGEVWLCTL